MNQEANKQTGHWRYSKTEEKNNGLEVSDEWLDLNEHEPVSLTRSGISH